VQQPNPNIYLIYSDDKGNHWSTPVQLNNDITGSSFQFMPQLAVDPFTAPNSSSLRWIGYYIQRKLDFYFALRYI
jgi:hypothetical protein